MTARLLNRPPRTASSPYAETDAALAALLRQAPGGLTRIQIARRLGIRYEVVEQSMNRLERRGTLLCEDAGLITLYQEENPSGEP